MQDSKKTSQRYKCKICNKIFSIEDVEKKIFINSESACSLCFNSQKLPAIFRNLKDEYDFKSKAKKLKNKSLFIFGSPGVGKTALSVFILKSLWSEGKKGKFISYPNWMFKIKTNYDSAFFEVEQIKKYPYCLVLDDFGAEKVSEFAREVSYLIIDHRESNRLQTIITSNFSLDEIDANIDRRISSRIYSLCEVLTVGKEDKRLIGKRSK